MRGAFQAGLSDAERSRVEPHLPAAKPRGRSRIHALREILDAVFFSYVVRSGCAWQLLSHDDFPPWKTVYHYFRAWRIDARAGEGPARMRFRSPASARHRRFAVGEATGGMDGEERGYDGGKR